MAIWQIRDVSRVSALHGLQFKLLDYDPETMRGFVMINNSRDYLLRIQIDLGKRFLSPADIEQRYDAGMLDPDQASYLREEAGIELAKSVYSFA